MKGDLLGFCQRIPSTALVSFHVLSQTDQTFYTSSNCLSEVGRTIRRLTILEMQLTTLLSFVLAVVVGYFVGRTIGVRDRVGPDRE